MVTVRIEHLRRVRAKGRTYWYHRKTGERLPDDETARIRRVLEINEGLDKPGRHVKVGSVEAVANVYRASHLFKNLAAVTQREYRARLTTVCDLWGDQPVASIQKKHVLALQDRFADKPATADSTVSVLRVLLAFAVEREYITVNPAVGVGKLRKPKDVEGHTPWPDWAIDRFLEMHTGTMMGFACALGIFTGQREGDVLRMTWGDIEGEYIKVKQSKTKTKLAIRIHRDLHMVLDQVPKRSTIILTTATGKPFRDSNFRHHFGKAMKAAGIAGLSFHGLRYAAAGKLAEAGCSIHQIAAVTGHQSLAMLAKYTKGAEQRRLGEAAILAWEKHAENAKVENRDGAFGKPKANGLKSNV